MTETMDISPALVEDLREYARARKVDVGVALNQVLHLGLEAAHGAGRAATEGEDLAAVVHRLERLVHGALGPRLFATTRVLAGQAVRNATDSDVTEDEYLSHVATMGRLEWEAFVADAEPQASPFAGFEVRESAADGLQPRVPEDASR